MISRRWNTFASFKTVPPDCSTINGRYIAPERVPYFRTLWRRRGTWVPLPLLMAAAGDMNIARAVDTLLRLQLWLPEGFRMEKKREAVYSDGLNPGEDIYHDYYRLTTDETLPPPTFTGKAMLEETEAEPIEVPLDEVRDLAAE